ncbi:MAG: glycoside hydrolase family 30 beta sandwich domain-containing protein [Opitutales bacterium]
MNSPATRYFASTCAGALLVGATALVTTRPAVHAAETAEIQIDAGKTFQTIDGFGTCLISWGQFPGLYYDEKLAKIYADDMGLDILRCELGFGSLPNPTPLEEISHENFSLDASTGRPRVFIEFAQKLKQVNPEMMIIGTVWSPPGWMKAHGQGHADPAIPRNGQRPKQGISALTYGTTQNYVTKEHYPHFVKWLVEMAKLWESEGGALSAISPGNEVMFSQPFQSNVWIAEDYAEIVALLGEGLDRAGLSDIRIFGPETMTGHNFEHGNPPYLAAIRGSDAMDHLDIWATHGYVDGQLEDNTASSVSEFWASIEDDGKPYWITEGGTGLHQWPAPLEGVAAAIHNSFVHGNASAFVPWQISGHEDTGNGSKHHLMVGHTMTKKSHAVRHFARTIERGAKRIEAKPSGKHVMASAYRHPEDGQLSVVLINPENTERDIELEIEGVRDLSEFTQYRTSEEEDFEEVARVGVLGGKARFTMPALSMVTLVGETYVPGASSIGSTPQPLAPARAWTSAEDPSRQIQAALLEVEGDIVRLRMANGQDVRVPLDKFSQADRDWVDDYR